MQVSIIIPTYNRASFIDKTLRSLCTQTSSDFEIIVVDDGSTDNTQEVVEAIEDNRINYFKKTNAERGAARNYGAAKAIGNYLNFFDSDDLAYDCHVSTALDYIKKTGNPEVFHQNYDVKDIHGKVLAKKRLITDINKQLISGNLLSCNGVFIRKDVFEKFRFSEDIKLSGSEDFLLWLQLSFAYRIHSIDKVTSSIVEHDCRSVITTDVAKLIERKTRLIEHLVSSCSHTPNFMNNKEVILSNTYLYVSLHLALLHQRATSLEYLWRGLKLYPLSVLSTKPIIIFKKILF